MRVAATMLLPLLLLSASPGRAQWLTQGESTDGDSSGNKNFTTPGASQNVASALLGSMRMEQRKRDLCWELGCIVIVNDSPAFKVVGFYVGEQVRGKSRWSRNQFGSPLLAKRATYRFKMPGKDCERPVRFTLRALETDEAVDLQGRVNFCPTPHVHSLLKIRVVRPTVTLE